MIPTHKNPPNSRSVTLGLAGAPASAAWCAGLLNRPRPGSGMVAAMVNPLVFGFISMVNIMDAMVHG